MSDVNFCENVTFVISGMSLGFVANAQLLLLRLKNHAGTVPDLARQSTRLCPANYLTLLGKRRYFAGQSTALCRAMQMRGQIPQIMRQFAPPWRRILLRHGGYGGQVSPKSGAK